MTREQAINYLFSSGFTQEQVCDVVRALTYEPTTKNDLGVDANKLLADCEKMSFEIEIFNKPLRVVALDAVKNIVKGLPSVTPQEPILDKLRAEIETKYGQCDICEYFEDYDYEENDISEYRPIGNIADIL